MMKNDNNKGFNKVGRIMEIFWLSLAIVSLLVVVYLYIRDGISGENLQYLVFPFMAGAMFFFRRFMRKKLERNDQQ